MTKFCNINLIAVGDGAEKTDQLVNLDLNNIVTPVNVGELHNLLNRAGYDQDKTRFLIEGFTVGFDLGYQGPQDRQSRSQNIPFSVGNDRELWSKLMQEVSLRRVAGPFQTIPFENYMQSLTGLVPKDNGRKTRLIFHLSYEFKDGLGSLNRHTPEHLCTVSYNDLDHTVLNCLNLVERLTKLNPKQQRPIIYFGKMDIQSAFRILPLKRSCWAWLVMMAKDPETGQICYFIDKCLPFSASRSCALFQAFSDALKFLLEYLAKIRRQMTNYLDDFLFLAVTRLVCDYLINTFLDLCKRLNVPISLEKTQWSSPLMVFLGILLNGYALTLGIPMEKKEKALNMINQFIDKRKATVNEVQSLRIFKFLEQSNFPWESLYKENVHKVLRRTEQ